MAWRTLRHDDQEWNVSVVAERRASAAQWCLVLAFRAPSAGRTVWAPFPLESVSRAMLFAHAEKIPNDQLSELLAERLQ